MQTYPPVPRVDDAPEGLLGSGHLWIQELVDGGQLRFQLRESGVLRFGDARREFGREVPPRYRHAVRHVRESLDRGALRAAVDDVETVVFVTEATHRQAVPYDFARLPPVLGLDVHDEDRGGFLPPDAVERVFDRLGLTTVNTFDREVRAADFDPTPDAVPESTWYDGPAAGIVVRNKTGDAAALAERLATDDLLRRVLDRSADDAFERVFEAVLRRHHGRLLHAGTAVDLEAFRSALAGRVSEWRTESA